MGYMQHHAIIVTCSGDAQIKVAHAQITELNKEASEVCWVSPISPAKMNGYQSFFIASDGSKRGWQHSNIADALRNEIIKVLKSFEFGDGSNMLDWVEVQYGDDNGENIVTRASL
jgi:hypothetical protein